MNQQDQPTPHQPTEPSSAQEYQLIVDALRATQQRQEFLLRLNDALAPIDDPVEIQQVAAHLLGEHLQADRTYYAWVEGDYEVAIIEREYRRGTAPSVVGKHAFADFGSTDAAYRAGRVMILEDVEDGHSVPDSDLPAFRALAIRSLVSTPLVKQGKTVASMTVLKGQPHQWTEQEVSLVQETAERTWAAVERANAEKALQKSEEKYRTLFNSMDEGFCIIEVLSDEYGRATDYRFLEANPAFVKQTGLENSLGKTMRELAPQHERFWFDTYGEIARTGKPQRFEHQALALNPPAWYDVYAFRIGQPEEAKVAIIFNDIYERKKTEQEVAQAKGLLQTMFDNSLQIMQLFKAVRNESGEIVDFEWLMTNKQWNERWGEMMGKRLLRENPAVIETGLFEQFRQVTESGVPLTQEHFYQYEQFDGWFLQTVAKVGDGFLLSTLDITERKQAEEALEQSEEKYRTLFENMGQGYALGEVIRDDEGRAIDLRYLELNPAFERLSGIPVAQAQGRTVREVYGTVEPEWFEVAERVARLKIPERVEYEIGAIGRWFQMHFYPAEGDRYLGLYEDVTDRKQAEVILRQSEERQSFLLRLSDALRPLADTTDIQQTAMQLLGQHLQVSRAFYGDMQADQDTLLIGPGYAQGTFPLDVQVRFSEFDADLSAYYGKGQTVVMDDVNDHPLVNEQSKAEFAQIDCRAAVGVPLLKGGTIRSILSLHQRVPRYWTTTEIELAQETAERTWAAVERAKAEDALRQSQERFKSTANLVPDLLWDSEPDGATNWYNNRWLAYTGQTVEQAIGWGWVEAIHPDDREDSARRYREAVAAGTSLRQEHRIRRHDGVYRWFAVSNAVVKNQTGQVVKLYGAATDIHDRKQAEEALQQADRRKDEFLAMLAHELRNPMSTIRSGLQILRLVDTKDELSRNTVEMMNRQTDHLVRMVDDLLDVSRISRGKIELKKGRVNLVDLVRQAQQSVESQFAQQGKRLHIRLPSTPIELEGDATRLTQVITNLLTNGVRYTGEQGQVWLSLEQHAQQAILQVRDNGIGLAADQLSAIFELFVQADNSLARSKGGLGLGLTLVRRLVEMHGGRVEATSQGLGQGSTFTVHLPTLTSTFQSTPIAAPQATDSATNRRILVIDDNADAGFTLAMLLKLKGYETHTRTSGRAGLEAAESLQPGAILLDIGMPELDGYTTCRLIREQSWGQAMIIIALTGYGQEEDRQRTREAGFNGHLVKPVDLGELTKLLVDLLDKDKKTSD